MPESFEIDDMHMRQAPDVVTYRILTAQSVTYKYLIAHNSKTVPLGDWTIGNLRDDMNGGLVLVSTKTASIPGGVPWHPTRIDVLDLPASLYDFTIFLEAQFRGHAPGDILPGKMIRMPHHLDTSCRVAVCLFDWNRSVFDPEHESKIHRLIEGYDIGPKFLGHITENNTRIIGYIVERLHGRAATAADYRQCSAVLNKLHSLGIALGEFTSRKECFRVDDDTGRVYIASFITAYNQGTSRNVFAAEQARLADTFGVAATHEALADCSRTSVEELQARFAEHTLNSTPSNLPAKQINPRHIPLRRPAERNLGRRQTERGCGDLRHKPYKKPSDHKLRCTESKLVEGLLRLGLQN